MRESVGFALQIIDQNYKNMSRKEQSKSKKMLEYLQAQEHEIVDSMQNKLESTEPLERNINFKP